MHFVRTEELPQRIIPIFLVLYRAVATGEVGTRDGAIALSFSSSMAGEVGTCRDEAIALSVTTSMAGEVGTRRDAAIALSIGSSMAGEVGTRRDAAIALSFSSSMAGGVGEAGANFEPRTLNLKTTL